MFAAEKDTIAAISTPIGFGGIGIVRLSGADSAHIARKVFRPPGTEKSNKRTYFHGQPSVGIIPRRLHYGYLVDPENPSLFNEVLLVYMPSPKSYTREDVVEIHAHGSTMGLKDILELVIRNGARLAEPGEFTRRAYLNGRIDLSQAEAVIDIIQAKTDASLRIANRNLEGDVGIAVNKIRKTLFEIQVMLEAQIDFAEEIEDSGDEDIIRRKISREILSPLDSLLDGYKHGHLLREGVRLVILGRTNVGKSSLLNRLIQRDRAIVTSYPGTTRDSIEESISLKGIPAVLVDTAGWRQTTDPVEKIGIDRTRGLALNADLILFMVDAASGIIPEDDEIYLTIQNKKKVLVLNKTDLLSRQHTVKVPDHWSFSETVHISAKFGNGLDSMKEMIYKTLLGSEYMAEGAVVPNLRQKMLLERDKEAIACALKGLNEKFSPDLISIDIQEAIRILDEITGDIVKTDILDEIFSRFCIGK